ncbi:hypothetical protein GCM10023189_12240 [Nibrella saemangeumensis]|uniref:Tetratricopeptide repeat protein n=1 Tax=Nibrella saemangeumensis TaxID=1084526 RepID=A0ABP8MHZ7_9BACT
MKQLLTAFIFFWLVTGFRFSVSLSPPKSPQAGRDTIKGLNNTAIKLAERSNFGVSLQLLDRADAGRPSDTLRYNRALVLGRARRYEEAAHLMSQLNFQHSQLNEGIFRCLMGDVRQGVRLLETATSHPDRASQLLYNRAQAHLLDDNPADAERTIEAAIRQKNNPRYKILKGDILLARERYSEALHIYEVLYRKEEQHNPGLLVRLGKALLGLKKYPEAQVYYQRYLSLLHPDYHFEARYGLASAFYGQRDYRRAASEFRSAVSLKPTSVPAHVGLGNALCSLKNYKEARTAFESAVALDVCHPLAQLGLGVVSYRQGNFEAALEALTQADAAFDDKDPDLADAFLSRGMVLLTFNRLDEALADLHKSARLNRTAAAYAGISEIYRKKDSYRYAVEFLEKAIRLSPQNDKLLTNIGNMHLMVNKIHEAHPSFSWAIRHNRHNVNALNGMGITLLEMDNLPAAMALYDSLIAHGQHRSFLFNNRGIVYAYMALRMEKEKQPHKAKQFYHRALRDFEMAREADSTRKQYFNNMGNVYKNTGEFGKAFASYEGHLDRSALNNMGVAFAVQNKGDIARYYLNLAIQLDSANVVYQYNRYKVYQRYFNDDLERRPDIARSQQLLPTNSISARYSKDGYINVYLYDFEFDPYTFPGEHHFPIQPAPLRPAELTMVDDFLFMVEETPESPKPQRDKPGKMPKQKRPRNLGSTSCPVI